MGSHNYTTHIISSFVFLVFSYCVECRGVFRYLGCDLRGKCDWSHESAFPSANSSEAGIHVAATCSAVTLSFLV